MNQSMRGTALSFLIGVMALFLSPLASANGYSASVLHSFSPAEGDFPKAGLIRASDGNYYGVTAYEGAGYGSIYKLSADGSFSVIHQFSNTDGAFPSATLTEAPDGSLYGTTAQGGTSNFGTLFRITPAGSFSSLYSFTGNIDGGTPVASLTLASDGRYYGVTSTGGAYNGGTIFRMESSGSVSTLYSFTASMTPSGGLVQASDGSLIGTTGNPYNTYSAPGSVYKFDPSGLLTTLHTFNGTDGAVPVGNLVPDGNGNYFGLASQGGINQLGVAFELDLTGRFTLLHYFSGQDGANPAGGLILGPDGNFYGVTSTDQAGHAGAVFRMTPDGGITPLAYVGTINGFQPVGPLAQDVNGNLLGATQTGGDSGSGLIFKLTPPASPLAAPPGLSLSASSTGAAVGTSVTLRWTSSGATSCSAFGGWSGSQQTSGSLLVPVQYFGNNAFILVCSGAGGTRSAVVNITGAQAPYLSLYGPSQVVTGSPIYLNWYGNGVDSCAASGDWSGVKSTSGSENFVAGNPGRKVYTLTCTGPAGSVSMTVNVTVIPPSVSFYNSNETPTNTSVLGQSTTNIQVFLSSPVPYAVTVPFTVGGTARPSTYDVNPAASLTFPANTTSAVITVKVKTPSLLQCDPTVVITLGTPSNATLGFIPTNTLTITDRNKIRTCP